MLTEPSRWAEPSSPDRRDQGDRWDRWAHRLWCLAAFGLPLGTAPTVAFSGLAVLVSLVSFLTSFSASSASPASSASSASCSRLNLRRVWHDSPRGVRHLLLICLTLFGWLSLSALWSIASWSELTESWSRYRRLLYVPLAAWGLWACWGPSRAQDWLRWFALGASLAALVSWAAYAGWTGLWFGSGLGQAGAWQWGTQTLVSFPPASNPAFGHSHIAAGAFLVVAANIWLVLGRFQLPGLVLAAVTATPVLLMQGRTGYVLLLISMAAWLVVGLITWRRAGWPLRGKPVWLAAAGLMVLVAWLQSSPHLIWRSQQAVSEVQSYVQMQPEVPTTSQGIRLSLWQAGVQMSTQSASTLVLGLGVGGYAQGYRDLKGQPTPEGSGQPHSEYVAMLVQAGLIGLGLWLWLWLQAFVLAWCHLTGLARGLWLLTLTLLVIDAGFNSVLWNMEEGHLLVLVLGGLAAACARPARQNAV